MLQLRYSLAGCLLLCVSLASAVVDPSAKPATPPPTTAPQPAPAPAPTNTPAPAPKPAPAPTPAPTTTPEASTALPPVAIPANDERAAVYASFKEQFAAGKYAEALPTAQKLVELTELRFGKDSAPLINPLTNLGTTQLRLQDYSAAEDTFQRAIKIAESRDGGFSRAVIKPLLGLGVTYSIAGQAEDASKVLSRAVDVSRKLDGLFNPAQIELVNPLIDSYVALGKIEDAEREQQYALRLNESAYGKDDPRMLPALDRNARWYESTGRYLKARQAQARALGIVLKSGIKNDVRLVPPLRGLARAYRLEFLYGSSAEDEEEYNRSMPYGGPTFNVGGVPTGNSPGTGRLASDGEKALDRAVEVAKAQSPASPGLIGDTLIDLGDWYQIASQPGPAMRNYKEAWQVLSTTSAPGTAALNAPMQIYYREPNAGKPDPNAEPEKLEQHYVEVEFTVGRDGRVKDVKTVTTDASDSQEKSVAGAIKRARYRPRFVDGEAVDTTGVRFRQIVFNKK